MRIVLNVIWLVFGGLWLALGYAVAGLLCCVLIVTIPFGIAALRIAGYALWPFGRTATSNPDAGLPSLLGNVIWLVVAGWWLALGHLLSGVAMCLTVIGIPLGIANFKLVPIALLPLGYRVASVDATSPGRPILATGGNADKVSGRVVPT